MPASGRTTITAPMLKMAWTVSIVVRPAATHLAITVGASEGDPQACQRDKPEGGDHRYHPEQAEFLPDQREDHIRTDLGHVRSLSARPRARPEETPGL